MYESMLRCFSFQFELRHKLCCTNFPDKGIVDVNFLLAVAAALVTLMDNNFLYQIVKHTTGAVSYTHLDVYKRQSLSSAISRRLIPFTRSGILHP